MQRVKNAASPRLIAVALFALAFGACTREQAATPAAPEPVTLTAAWIEPGAPPQFDAPKMLRPAPTGATPDLEAVYEPTPPLKAPFGYGVASGDVTQDGAVLWTRTPEAAEVAPEVSATADFARPMVVRSAKTTAATDFTAKVVVNGLQAGKQYYYRFRAGSDVSPVGTFKTAYAPTDRSPVALGFTGDADWKWKPYPVLDSLAKEKLDLFVFLGDTIYETQNLRGNVNAESLDEYRFKYRENREPRAGSALTSVPMQELYRAFGHYALFDNHETGPSTADRSAPPYNDGGVSANGTFVNKTPGYRARMRAFSEYQPMREEPTMAAGDPQAEGTQRFYRTVPWGANVQLIVLDDRSYRDRRLPNSDAPEATTCARSMLGATQFKWAQDELLAAKRRGATWKVLVVSSPMQQQGRASDTGVDMDGSKSWAGGYHCERNRLLKFIDDNTIDNVVVLTTDNHATVINNLSYNTDPADPKSALKPARNSFEIMTGPLGAGTGNPAFKVNTTGLPLRDADRAIVDVWNGDAPNTDGETRGLKQAGLDPIGLEATFPGLDAASVAAAGVPAGKVEATAFASFRSFTYSLLTFDQSSVAVRVMGLPAVTDATTLLDPERLKAYEGLRANELMRFKVNAQ